jgi:hypothetical protein
MGICCSKGKPVDIRSLQHLNEERCVEYLSNSGVKIYIDKKEHLLAEYFLAKDLLSEHPVNADRKRRYLRAYDRFKSRLQAISLREIGTRESTLHHFKHASKSEFYGFIEKSGLPLKYRWQGWRVALDTVDIAPKDFNQLISHKNEEVETIVSKDVPRTFPTNPFFKDRIENIDFGREILHKVCSGIGNYFTEVGYTQGFNLVAGYCLQLSGGYTIQVFSFLRDLLIDDRFCLIGLYDRNFALLGLMKFLVRRKLA